MKASSGALLVVMAVAALSTTALAKNYTIDGSIGWDTYINYDKWTAHKIFMVGDFIEFKYKPYHNVLEVMAEDYTNCVTSHPMETYSGGNTAFELTETGTRYFICGIPLHCTNGTMHVKITTVAYDAATAAAIEAAAAPGAAPFGSPLPSPPADVYADAITAPAGAPSSTKSSASASRYEQTSAAIAGLAFAALVAIAA